SLSQHLGAQRRNERPVFVSVGALHFCHDVHTDIETGKLMLPGQRLTHGPPKNVKGRPLWSGLPFEVAGPPAAMPARIQRGADVTTITARMFSNASFTKNIQQSLKRIGVTEQIAIFGRFGDAIVDTGQAAG